MIMHNSDSSKAHIFVLNFLLHVLILKFYFHYRENIILIDEKAAFLDIEDIKSCCRNKAQYFHLKSRSLFSYPISRFVRLFLHFMAWCNLEVVNNP